MNEFFGPLDSKGRVPPHQQTRVAAFLISAHGALARQFAGVEIMRRLIGVAQLPLQASLDRKQELLGHARELVLGL